MSLSQLGSWDVPHQVLWPSSSHSFHLPVIFSFRAEHGSFSVVFVFSQQPLVNQTDSVPIPITIFLLLLLVILPPIFFSSFSTTTAPPPPAIHSSFLLSSFHLVHISPSWANCLPKISSICPLDFLGGIFWDFGIGIAVDVTVLPSH